MKKIPIFKTEEEAVNFWATRDSIDYLDELQEENVQIAPELRDEILGIKTSVRREKEEDKVEKISIEKEREIKESLKQEFPNDKVMQELHFHRWINYLKTKNFTIKGILKYYNQDSTPRLG